MKRYVLLLALALPFAGWAADVSVSGRVSVGDEHKSIDVAFSSGDKRTIQNYYRSFEQVSEEGKSKHGGKKMPPGLAKRDGNLPPGLAKRKNLPPGLAKRDRLPEDVEYETLPRDLEAKLPPLPSPDYVRVRVGTDFAIMNKKSRVVFDIATGLVR